MGLTCRTGRVLGSASTVVNDLFDSAMLLQCLCPRQCWGFGGCSDFDLYMVLALFCPQLVC